MTKADDFGFPVARQRKPHLCKCGCGNEIPFSQTWVTHHNIGHQKESKAARMKRARGMLAANKAKHKARVAKFPRQKCLCGCGQYPAQRIHKWLPGHNAVAGQKRHYSEETLAAFKENAKRSTEKAKASGAFHSEKWQKAMSRPQAEEHKKKNSEGVKRAVAQGKFDPAENIRRAYAEAKPGSKLLSKNRYKPGRFYSKKMNCWFQADSSWELEHMQALESSPAVKAYTRIPKTLKYTFEGKQHSYLVDFGVFYKDGRIAYEEIKPSNLLSFSKHSKLSEKTRKLIERNQTKLTVLRRFCESVGYECRVLTTLEECRTSA